MESEIWKQVKWYEGLYEVSNTGVVKRISQKIQIGNRSVLFNGKIMVPLQTLLIVPQNYQLQIYMMILCI